MKVKRSKNHLKWRNYFNSLKYTYKGKEYSYRYIHIYINNKYGSANRCENPKCLQKSNRFEWSNISHQYKFERSDWQQLCKSCHQKFDITNETVQKAKIRMSSSANKFRKTVYQYSLENKFINSFVSAHEAERQTGINCSNICSAARGTYKQAGGYLWKYTNKTS